MRPKHANHFPFNRHRKLTHNARFRLMHVYFVFPVITCLYIQKHPDYFKSSALGDIFILDIYMIQITDAS